MRGILQFILYSIGGRHIEQTAPLQKLPVRPREQLAAILEAHGSALATAMAGAINSEEYLLLDSEAAKVVRLRPAIPKVQQPS